MPMQNIRKAKINDGEVIVSYIRSMLKEMAEMGGHPVNQNDSFWLSFNKNVLPDIENLDRLFLIADINNRPVGFLEGRTEMRHEVYEPKKSFHIRSVFVNPESRHRGIATNLIKKALNYAAAQGCHEADLNILSNNHHAKRVYDKIGFKVFQHEMRVLLPITQSIDTEMKAYRKDIEDGSGTDPE